MSNCEDHGPIPTENETPSETENRSKVLIIGGGMAGLSAAYHLTKNGFTDFKLLEARNRLGGRIVQIAMTNERVELGANWIHGILGNPVYELAMEHGLVDILQCPKPHKVVAATEAGKQVPFNVLHEIYEAYLCFLRRCEEYYVTQYLPPDGIDSVGDHIRLEVQLYLDSIKDNSDRHLRQLIFECLLKRETCISGCDNMSEIDLLEIGSYTELQGGNIVLPQGYSSILEPVSKDIDKSSIYLRHAVTLIQWNKNGNVESNGDESDDSDRTVIEESSSRESSLEKDVKQEVEVTCENGKKFFADHVICTMPLGVLKHKADTIFQPPLPDYKLEAIDRLLFGTVDKIILEYERPFLNPNITEVLLLWDDSKDEGTEKGNYQATWFKKIYSFAKVSDTLLVGWISGKEAEYMETLPSDLVAETCTSILRKFLNDPFIPKPKTCVW